MVSTKRQELVHSRGYGWLLAAQLILILASPIVQTFATIRWTLAVAYFLVLIAGIRVLADEAFGRFCMAIGIVALVGHLGDLGWNPAWLDILRLAGSAVFFFLSAGLIYRNVMVRSEKVDTNLIAGSINVYLMAGLAFGFVHATVDFLQPGSLKGLEAFGDQSLQIMSYIYFSFVTMTTLGYGDVSPLLPLSMTIAYVQALFGQLFIAITIAWLVGLHIAQKGND